MRVSKRTGVTALIAVIAMPTSASLAAQQQEYPDTNIVVTGTAQPAATEMVEGPEIKGIIAARNDDKMKVTAADGTSTVVAITDATRIRAAGGLFSGRNKRGAEALLNGLPVTVKTLQAGDV